METRPEKVQVLHRPNSMTDEVAAQLRDAASISRATKPPILIVDDIKLTVRVTLKSLGGDWQCEVARDGEQAVEMALKNVYNVILMDVNLPKLNGTEATQEIRKKQKKHLTIFGLTASFDAEDLDLYAQSGMDGCIAKGSVLRRAVQTAVKAKQKARPNQFIFVNEQNQVVFRDRPEIDTLSASDVDMTPASASASTGGATSSHARPQRNLFRPPSLGKEEKTPFHLHSPTGRGLPKKPEAASFKFGDVDATDARTFNRLHGDNVGDFRKHMLRKGLIEKQRASKTPPGELGIPLSLQLRKKPGAHLYGGEEEARQYSKSCLLVDDNPLTVKVTTRAVKTSGMRCDVAVDGEEAVQKAFDGRYQLILMDVMLPGFDGCEATHRIRDHEKENNLKKVPILGLTGNTDIDDLRRYAESGMDGCIEKGATIKTAIKDAISIMKDDQTSFVFINGKNVQSLPCERNK